MSHSPVSRKLRIAHVLSSFGTGGQEFVALELAMGQVERGHEVYAVSLAPPPDGPMAALFAKARVPTITLGKRQSGFDWSLPPRLAWWIKTQRLSVVHTHNPTPLLYSALASRVAGAALIHSKHGINPGSKLNRRARRLLARLTHSFVAVSDVTAEQAMTQRDCPPDRLRTINNGIDVRRFRPDPEARREIRDEFGIAQDAWVVGTVGRLDRNKNQALLIAAAGPHLAENWHLIHIGDGPTMADIRALVDQHPKRDHIHLAGRRGDVERCLNAFDVFALSSDSEGLPLVIPEAMATKIPVVSTAVGGIPKVVVDGETGYLVPPGDEAALSDRLAALSANREKAKEFGERGYERALSEYSARRMGDDYMALYYEALS